MASSWKPEDIIMRRVMEPVVITLIIGTVNSQTVTGESRDNCLESIPPHMIERRDDCRHEI